MESYTKLSSSIVNSTIWDEANETRLVWITLLALADQHGEIMSSLPGLAHQARVDIQECQKALDVLLAPDEYSRTPDHDGRRIEAIDGGWALLNHEKYRHMASDDDRRRKAAERQRRKRERDRHAQGRDCHAQSVTGRDESRLSQQAEAEAGSRSKREKTTPSGGGSLPKRKAPSRKPTEAQTRAAVKQRLGLATIEGFEDAVVAWREALGARKRWASVAALEARLRWLEQHAGEAMEMVRICTEEAWTDPVHAAKRLGERNGKPYQQTKTPTPGNYRPL